MNNAAPQNSHFVAVLSWVALILALMCLTVLAWYLPSNRSHFITIFRDFNLELPALTRFVIAIPSAVFPVIAGLIGLGAFVMQWRIRSKNGMAVVHMLVIVFCCVVFEIYREAMAQPMVALIEGIEGISRSSGRR